MGSHDPVGTRASSTCSHAAMLGAVPVLAGPDPTELTIPTVSVVSVARVSFSLSGGACLSCGFTGLFSSGSSVSVPGGGSGATCSFGRGGQRGALLLFSLNVSQSCLSRTDEAFSITPLCVRQKIQKRKVRGVGLKTEPKRHLETEEGRSCRCRLYRPRPQRGAHVAHHRVCRAGHQALSHEQQTAQSSMLTGCS